MAHVSRVPSPRSPLDGWWRVVAFVVLGFGIVAVLKPWGRVPDDPRPLRPSEPRAAATAEPAYRSWDPASLGTMAPPPAWELWAAGDQERNPFVGPVELASGSSAAEFHDTGPIGGPVIGLGESDDVTAFLINRPPDVQLGAVRLWRLEGGRDPERVEIVELPDPWNAGHIQIFALHGPGMPDGTVGPWRAGLYRLDLLIEPTDRIRTLLLNVRPGPDMVPLASASASRPPLDVRLLQRLPEAAERWAFGQVLVGWAYDATGNGAEGCRVADIWGAGAIRDPCHPTPVGRPTALGVNLGPDRPVLALELRQVDPLPGGVAARISLEVNDRPGLAMAEATVGPFADGIYRLAATTPVGTVAWYVEVGPDPLE